MTQKLQKLVVINIIVYVCQTTTNYDTIKTTN